MNFEDLFINKAQLKLLKKIKNQKNVSALYNELYEEPLSYLIQKGLLSPHYTGEDKQIYAGSISISQKGANYLEYLSSQSKNVWIDRLWGFVTGSLFSAFIAFIIEILK